MNTLRKHKKNGEEGFKKFVASLEGMTEATRLKVVQVAILEDPVYLMAALSNMTSFDYIFTFGTDELKKLYDNVGGGMQTLLFALYGHPKEQEFLSAMEDKVISSYRDEKEYFKEPNPGQIESARKSYLATMRKLQIEFLLPQFEWKLPSSEVISGSAFDNADSNGTFILKYDDGKLALEGELEKKLRVGEWKHFYPNGQLMAEGVYVSSEKAGDWTFYYADGKVKAKGEYRENLREGQWEEFDRDGMMIHVIYKRGKADV